VSILDPGKNVFTNLALAGYPEWVKVGENMAAEDVLEDMKDEFRVGENSYYVKFEDQAYGIDAFGFLAHPELADKPRSTSDAWHERDILMVSLKDRRGRLIGYMLVDEPVDLKVPTKEQIDVLEILGGIASIAVENSKAYERQVVAVNEIALLNDLMTHDINNFNQGIMGYIELLLQDSRLDEGQRKYAEKALMQVRNNARVIDNIRKLSKVRALSEKELTIWDLHDSVNSAIETISKSHTERTVYVTPAVPKGVHYVRANHFMNEVFLNILSNAVKFDNSKIVKIDLKIEEVSDTQGEFWQISIADHGRGIPDDRKRAIFERLTTGMTGVKGFGLGLSIVSTIVEKLQGRVWVEDRVAGDYSKGTVFKIMLPKVMREENSRGSSVK
jgi:signal transduction histidine kinase